MKVSHKNLSIAILRYRLIERNIPFTKYLEIIDLSNFIPHGSMMDEGWDFPDKVADKIRQLNEPNWRFIIKAWKAKHYG